MPLEEVEAKGKAILYRTQPLVMGRFPMSFARTNELFVMEKDGVGKEMGKISCCGKQ